MRAALVELLGAIASRARKFSLRSIEDAVLLPKKKSLSDLAKDLISTNGEASGVAIAETLLKRYASASELDRLAFLNFIVEELGSDPELIAKAIRAQAEQPSLRNLELVHRSSEPKRQELLRRLNLAPGGTLALVRMREHVLSLIPENSILRSLDDDFLHLFASWFNRGFLLLKRIDWNTSASVLEKLMEYESVHQMTGWSDLKARLKPSDRRCFAFFHPQLVDEPLIFVEVALTEGMPSHIGLLLEEDRVLASPMKFDTAVFYSISNCQKGLAQVSFGNFLIKQVVEEIKNEIPQLKNFVTLSPVPGFRHWLEQRELWCQQRANQVYAGKSDEEVAVDAAYELACFATDYLVSAKNNRGRPLDPVARFHLGNGACLDRINAAADLSAKGIEQSYGVMVNYRYDLAALTENHERYAAEGIVAIGRSPLYTSPRNARGNFYDEQKPIHMPF